ncbi:MAG: hypothetical protein IJP66_08110, partial [Kiritimatiellae bacterium]|nr:hypothetical protein [Kiritimatiellia bacterium]
PLMLGPLFVHACLSPERSSVQFVLARVLGDVAVPAFFFIAGLLYFAGFDGTARCYARKLRGRARSLAVPYLLWNLIGYVLLAYAVPMVGKADFFNSFWAVRVAYRGVSTAPVDGPLYFIKGLAFLSLGAPLGYLALRERRLAWTAPLAAAFWVASPVAALDGRMAVVATSMFMLGGFFAVRAPGALPPLATPGRPAAAAVAVFAAVALVTTALHLSGLDSACVRRLCILAGIPCSIALGGMLARSAAGPLLKRSQGFAMFLFCSFDLIIAASRKAWRPLRDMSDATCVGVAAGTFAMSLAAYLLLRAVAPWLLRLLTGGRR